MRFLYAITILCLGLLMACQGGQVYADKENAADVIFLNGIIYDVENAEAVVVKNGKIQYIGNNEMAQQSVGKKTRIIDLGGQFLMPGFIDNHVHAGEGGEVNCLADDRYNIENQASLLKKCGEKLEGGEWVIGYGMHLDQVLGEGPPYLNPRKALDEIFPLNPVIIMEHSSHAMFVNSQAMQIANIAEGSPDPQGGVIMKDEGGAPNGVLVDNAGDIVMEVAVNSLNNKQKLLEDGITYGLNELKRNGITTIGDGRTYWKRGMMDVWKRIASRGELTARVSIRPWIYPSIDQREQIQFLEKNFQDDIDELLIVNQVKMYSDGVPENGTARVNQPYAESYFPQYPQGINYIDQEQMLSWLKALRKIGYGAHIHAIGDLGIHETLNIIEQLRAEGSKLKYSITHLSMVEPIDLPRFSALEVDADIQVGDHAMTADDHSKDFVSLIGESRASEILYRPLKELQETDANVVLSSDWSVNPLSPLIGIAVSVEEGSLTMKEAINAYTINPAKALGLDKLTGSIAVGKSADFVVLNQDIRTLPPQRIRKAKVMMTILEGKVVYE